MCGSPRPLESLLNAVDEVVTGQPSNNLSEDSVLDSRLLLLGAVVPLDSWCCSDYGARPFIPEAWTSGRMLADHILSSNPSSHGRTAGSFKKLESTTPLGSGALPTHSDGQPTRRMQPAMTK